MPGFHKKKRFWVIFPVILFASSALVVAVTFATKTRNSAIVSHSPVDSRPVLLAAADRLPAVIITIRPTGFDPAEIKSVSGRFLLAADNKSGLSEVTLRLSRDDGAFMREFRISPERHRLREKLNLRAGNYLLTEANHANWICRITVAP